MSAKYCMFTSPKIHPICEVEQVCVHEGKTSYYGIMQNGKKNIQGIYVDRSAHVEYTGEWKEDHIHGKGTIKNYFDQREFTGEFNMNRMVRGTLRWADGTVYQGGFENDELSGVGKLQWANGSTYEGKFANGAICGPGVYKHRKGIAVKFGKGR
jgi:hypothetical protein